MKPSRVLAFFVVLAFVLVIISWVVAYKVAAKLDIKPAKDAPPIEKKTAR